MALTVQAKIRCVILLTGIAILCLGSYLLTAGFMIKKQLKGHSNYLNQQDHYDIPRYSGYWAGIPVIITGILLLASTCTRKHTSLLVVCVIFLLISMVVTLGVISEEGANETYVHNLSKGRNCAGYQGYTSKEDCKKAKAAAAWYQILLVCADVLLVICNVALLAIFAKWILFARKEQHCFHDQFQYGYQRYPTLPVYEETGRYNQAAIISREQPMHTNFDAYEVVGCDPNIQTVELPQPPGQACAW